MKSYSSAEPEEIVYMLLPDGLADVWIHHNIELIQEEDGPIWVCDETYFRTSEAFDEIDFEEAFDNPEEHMYAKEIETVEEPKSNLEERVHILEEAVIELGRIYSAAADGIKGTVVS